MSDRVKAAATEESDDDGPSTVRRSVVRRPPRGVILAIDGTLLDGSDAHAHSWLEALAGEGTAVPYATVRRQLGKGGEKQLWELLRVKADSIIGRAITRHRREIWKTFYLPNLSPFPETRVLLQRMRHEGIVLHVATSAGSAEVEDVLRAAWISDLVQRTAVARLNDQPASDLDIVAEAVARSGLPASDLLMLADTPFDVGAARDVGVGVVALRSGGWSDADLSGALAIYDDPADLARKWDDSPFAATAEVRAVS